MAKKKNRPTPPRRRHSAPRFGSWGLALLLLLAGTALIYATCVYTPAAEVSASSRPNDLQALTMVHTPQGQVGIHKEYTGFEVDFNPGHHNPNYVTWTLTPEEARAEAVSRTNKFYPDPQVETCAQLSDYRNSGFDRGHMAPAGDMKWSAQAMEDCFYLTNICPQAKELNTGAWKNLETNCRRWALQDSTLVIVTGPIYDKEPPATIGNGVAVPTRFFKVILAPYANPPRAIGFVMPNAKVPGGMAATATSVDEVEKLTGYDFFSSLPDDEENRIEAQYRLYDWTRK